MKLVSKSKALQWRGHGLCQACKRKGGRNVTGRESLPGQIQQVSDQQLHTKENTALYMEYG